MQVLIFFALAYIVMGWCFAAWHSPTLVDRRVTTMSALRTIVMLWTLWPIWLLLRSLRSPHGAADNPYDPD